MAPSSPGNRDSIRHQAMIPRFRDALRGVWTAYREEPNLRIHVFAATGAMAAGIATGLSGAEALYLAGTVTLVILLELVNTAVERTVDLAANGKLHPLAATAKEVAAGAVLVAAVHALAVGLYLFAWRISFWETLWLLAGRPFLLLLPTAALIAGLVGGRKSEG